MKERLTALSRNRCCSLESGRRRLAFVSDCKACGEASDDGGADDVVIDARAIRSGRW